MLAIENISAKLPKGNGAYQRRNESDITAIVIHHSAADARFGPYDFARWHIDANGWPGIGYHFVIMSDGTIYQTNELSTVSYQTQGHNAETLGICLSGNFEESKPPEKQMRALGDLIKHVKKQVPSIKAIKAHRDYKSTSCPGKYLLIEDVEKYAQSSSNWLLWIGLLAFVIVGLYFIYRYIK